MTIENTEQIKFTCSGHDSFQCRQLWLKKTIVNIHLGKKIRELREKKNLLLLQVAAYLEMNTALMSKIEREERKATKQQLIDLIKFYELDEKQIMVEWNSQKLLNQLKSENYAIDILNQSIKKLKSKK